MKKRKVYRIVALNTTLVDLMKSRFFFIFLFLVGCASQTPSLTSTTEASSPAPTRDVHAVTSWEIKGLMGAKTPKKAWSANLVWEQRGPHHYQLRVFGPMGGGTMLIEGDSGRVTYQDQHKRIQGKQARQLLREQTGIDLPVEALYYWVRGLPAPGKFDAKYDENKQLTDLKQAGYAVNYSQYQVVDGYMLPVKMKIQSNALLVKLVIKHWQLRK